MGAFGVYRGTEGRRFVGAARPSKTRVRIVPRVPASFRRRPGDTLSQVCDGWPAGAWDSSSCELLSALWRRVGAASVGGGTLSQVCDGRPVGAWEWCSCALLSVL